TDDTRSWLAARGAQHRPLREAATSRRADPPLPPRRKKGTPTRRENRNPRAVKGNPHSEDRQESAGPPKAAEGCKFRLLQPHDVQQPNGRQQGKQKQTAR